MRRTEILELCLMSKFMVLGDPWVLKSVDTSAQRPILVLVSNMSTLED